MKLSFSTKGWHGYLWEDFCRIATEQGFNGIELHNVNNPSFTEKNGAFYMSAAQATVRNLYEKNLRRTSVIVRGIPFEVCNRTKRKVVCRIFPYKINQQMQQSHCLKRIILRVFRINIHKRFFYIKVTPRLFILWGLNFKNHSLFEHGMRKRQSVRPQREMSFLRLFSTIAHIAVNGRSEMTHLHTNLMRSARMQTNICKR